MSLRLPPPCRPELRDTCPWTIEVQVERLVAYHESRENALRQMERYHQLERRRRAMPPSLHFLPLTRGVALNRLLGGCK
jgi:hypothetical protein